MIARLVAIAALFVLVACSSKSDDAPAPAPAPSASAHDDEPGHDAPRRVRLDPAVIADANVKTAPATRRALAATIDLTGEIAADPDKTAKLSSPLPGRLERVSFREGEVVRKGDVVATVRVPELGKAKAAAASLGARARAARSNADRLEALADKRLAATQEMLGAKAEADALEADARAANEQLAALGTGSASGSLLTLRAPIGGVVVSRDAVVGQPITAEQTLAVIADLTEVWFLARVFEKNLGQVRVGAPVEVELNAYPAQRFVGTVGYLGKQVDPSARTIVARIALVNRDDALRIGLFGTALVGTGDAPTSPPAIVVPRSAVTEVGGKPVVFVRQPDGDFDLHEVVLGDGALGQVEIVRGLREGELVVVDGVFTLKSALLKSAFGGDD